MLLATLLLPGAGIAQEQPLAGKAQVPFWAVTPPCVFSAGAGREMRTVLTEVEMIVCLQRDFTWMPGASCTVLRADILEHRYAAKK